MQFQSLLIGYDLLGYVTGTKSCLAVTIIEPDSTTQTQNPDYTLWIRQDQLLLNAIIGSLTPTIVPFIAASKTSHDAWNTLEKTYDAPTRGRIMQLRSNLAYPENGTRSVTEYMQDIKSSIDALALMNVTIDFDEPSIRILEGPDKSY